MSVLPESLPRERRAPFEWRRANPLGSLALLRSHRELLGLASVNFLGQLAHAVLPSVTVLYMGYRYGWDERTVGLVMAGVGICSMVVQGALIGPVVRRFGERSALILGLLFGTAGFATYGIASTGSVFLVGVPLMALWGFASPAALGLMSRRVGPHEQGQVQGANGSIAGIANMIGPGLFTQVFAAAIASERSWHFPGAPFGLAALMLLATIVIAWRVRVTSSPDGRPRRRAEIRDSLPRIPLRSMRATRQAPVPENP